MRPIRKDALLLVILGSGFLFSATGWSVTGADRSERSDNEILVETLQGAVDVATGGIAREVAVGSVIGLPSRIATGDDGNISIRQSRTGVSVGPESEIEIPAAARDGQLIARMVQHRGTVFYDVEPRPIEKLTIETPNLVAVVKGTQFSVVAEAESTTVSLFEGVLELRSPDGTEIVEIIAGQIATGSPDDGILVLPMDADLLEETAAVDTPLLGGPAGQTIDDVGSTSGIDALAGLAEDTLGGNPAGTLGDPDGTVAAAAGFGTGAGPLQAAAAVSGPFDGAGLDTGLTGDADLAAGGVEVGLDTGLAVGADVGAGSVEVGLDTGIDVGADLAGGSVDVGLDADLDAGADLAGGSVEVGLDAGLDVGGDLGGGGVDVGLDTGLDAGADLAGGSVDVGLDAGLDVGGDLGGGVDVGLDTGVDAGADLAGGSVDVGLDVGLDVGGEGVGLDTGLEVDLGDTGLDAGIDVDLDTGGDLVEEVVDDLDSTLDEVLDLGDDDGTDTGLADVLDLGGDDDEGGGLIPSLPLL